MKTPPVKQTLVEQHVLESGTISVYPNILACEYNEGVHVDFEQASFPIQIAQITFGDEKPWVYISHRSNSYSWDPIHYREIIGLFPNIIAFAVVSKNEKRRTISNLERLFSNKPMESFKTIAEAIEWAETKLETPNQL